MISFLYLMFQNLLPFLVISSNRESSQLVRHFIRLWQLLRLSRVWYYIRKNGILQKKEIPHSENSHICSPPRRDGMELDREKPLPIFLWAMAS